MKKTISILILLILMPTLCFAGALQEKQRQVIAKKNVAAPAASLEIDATSASSGGDVSSITWSHTVSGSDRVLFVGVANQTAQPTGVTYNGDALTSVFTDVMSVYYVSGWVLIAPDTGAHDIVVTYSGTVTGAGAYGISFTGAHQTTAVGTPATSHGWGSTSTIDVTAETGDIVVDIMNYGAATEPSIGANQTQVHTVTHGSTYQKGSREAGASTTTMSWTHDTQNHAQGGVAIKKK